MNEASFTSTEPPFVQTSPSEKTKRRRAAHKGTTHSIMGNNLICSSPGLQSGYFQCEWVQKGRVHGEASLPSQHWSRGTAGWVLSPSKHRNTVFSSNTINSPQARLSGTGSLVAWMLPRHGCVDCAVDTPVLSFPQRVRRHTPDRGPEEGPALMEMLSEKHLPVLI